MESLSPDQVLKTKSIGRDKDTIWHQLEKLLSAVILASARCTVSEKQCHHEILATEKNIQ